VSLMLGEALNAPPKYLVGLSDRTGLYFELA
jgi:hypothetical protein